MLQDTSVPFSSAVFDGEKVKFGACEEFVVTW